jgi:hypothetical protein
MRSLGRRPRSLGRPLAAVISSYAAISSTIRAGSAARCSSPSLASASALAYLLSPADPSSWCRCGAVTIRQHERWWPSGASHAHDALSLRPAAPPGRSDLRRLRGYHRPLGRSRLRRRPDLRGPARPPSRA